MTSTVAATRRHLATDARTARRGRGTRSHARWIARAEIAALLLIGAALVFATLATRGATGADVAHECVRVERGQTLWTLAEQYPVAGLSTEQTAQLIASLNHLDSQRLTTGSTIQIPARLEDGLTVAWR